MLEKIKNYFILLLIGTIIAGVIYAYAKQHSHDSELARLRNDVAAKDTVIEEMKGTYTKLAQENDDLKASDKNLQKLLDKTKQDLVAEQALTLQWKGKYEYALEHTPITPIDVGSFTPPAEPTKCTADPKAYTATQDIGMLAITVQTFTLDPNYQQHLLVGPGSVPLHLTLDLTRDKNKQWHTHVQSSDDRVGVDIGVNSVNTDPLDESWYEHIRLHMDAGGGAPGVLGGLGLSLQFGQFEVGPAVWSMSNANGPFYGLNLSWQPFKRSN